MTPEQQEDFALASQIESLAGVLKEVVREYEGLINTNTIAKSYDALARLCLQMRDRMKEP